MSYPEAPFLSRTELPIQNTHTTGRSGGPGRRAGGRTTLQTSSNWRILKRPSTGPVTNVVNLRPKTTIFNEKAAGLTTFITTDPKSTRKTPWIDDVCNNTQKIGQKSQRARPLRYPRAAPQRPGTTGVEGTGGTGGYGCGVRGRRRVLAGLFTATRHHWCGGRRRDRRAWLRCPWAVAGPGRRPRAQPAARPKQTTRRPEHQRRHKQQHSGINGGLAAAHSAARPRHAETPPRGCGTGLSLPSRV